MSVERRVLDRRLSKKMNLNATQQVILLSALLGTLLVIVGVSGIYVAKKSSTQVTQLNDTALGPTIAFSEIVEPLNQLSQNLLKLNQIGVTKSDAESIIKKSKSLMKGIRQKTQTQVNSSHGLNYENYLNKWQAEWSTFEEELNTQLDTPKQHKVKLASFYTRCTQLTENMGNISDFIQTDVKDMLDQARKFSTKMTVVLSIFLFMGFLIGMSLSVVIIRSIQSLFGIIAQGKKNMQTLLDNLDQGFFVLDRSGIVQQEVSKAAKTFLGNDPTGKTFYESLPVDEKSKEDAKGWHKLIYEGALGFKDFKPLAPKDFWRNEKYIELDFRPIYHDGSRKLDKVICIASDKTEEVRLKEKAQAETALVKLVMAVLSDRGTFVDFVLETRKVFVILEKELKKKNPDLDVLFRGMHSLKGGAAAYNLIKISHEAHKFENILAEMKVEGGKQLAEFIPELESGVISIKNYFEGFLKEHEAILGKIDDNSDRTKVVPVGSIYHVCQMIFHHIGKESPVFSEFLEKFVQEDVAEPFKRYESVVTGIAQRQMKKVEFKLDQGKIKIFLDPYVPLFQTLIHAFRNAVDHGIEDEITREEKGKPVMGFVEVKFEKVKLNDSENLLRIKIRDDGAGINPEKIKEIALKKKLLSESDAKRLDKKGMIDLLFKSGFSTREEVSDLSGRGVGLDAIRHEATQLGGSTWLESEIGKGSTLIVEVPFLESPFLPNVMKLDKSARAA